MVMEAMEADVAAAAFLSPATVHVTRVLAGTEAGAATVSTRLPVLQATVPADTPMQV